MTRLHDIRINFPPRDYLIVYVKMYQILTKTKRNQFHQLYTRYQLNSLIFLLLFNSVDKVKSHSSIFRTSRFLDCYLYQSFSLTTYTTISIYISMQRSPTPTSNNKSLLFLLVLS